MAMVPEEPNVDDQLSQLWSGKANFLSKYANMSGN
jgi:hypothetical protein